MKETRKIAGRPIALVVIVAYKAATAILLAIIAIVLLLVLHKHQDYQNLISLENTYTLEGKQKIIEWILAKILSLNPKTLRFSGITAAAYAAVTAIEGLGLWFERAWARILVLVLVGVSIPAEIFELLRGVTLLKLAVFLVNLAVFYYLWRELPKQKVSAQGQNSHGTKLK